MGWRIEKTSGKKPEFSKRWLVAVVVVSTLFTAASYILSWMDKNPVENLSIAIVQIMWAVDGVCFIGYNAQNSIRAYSQNKFSTTSQTLREGEEADEKSI